MERDTRGIVIRLIIIQYRLYGLSDDSTTGENYRDNLDECVGEWVALREQI